MESPQMTRRGFLRTGVACTAHLALMAAPFPLSARAAWSRRSLGQVVAQEPFGRLERIGEGLWALISTPLGGDYTTVANGGIIAGRDGVVAIEAFQTPEGAEWLARQARALTGRWPTHVLVTHHHGDHSRGVEGYRGNGGAATADAGPAPHPALHATTTTRDITIQRLPAEASSTLRRAWTDVTLLPEEAPSELELGDRTLRITPRRGHTESDITVALPEDGITWCGDLVWNGMFPNYVDAVPSRLGRAVQAIEREARAVYVPGHGPLANGDDLARYRTVIEGVEQTARRARSEGWTAEEAAARHEIPESLGEWTLFSPSYIQRAIEAWLEEWERGGGRRGTRGAPPVAGM